MVCSVSRRPWWKREQAGGEPTSPVPARDALVDAAERVVRAQLVAVGGEGAAAVDVVWSGPAGMWFIEVQPNVPGAAAVSVGVSPDGFVVSLPNGYWEIGRSARGPDPLDVLAEDLGAVFAGRVEEAGSGTDRPVRLVYNDGRVRTVGAVRLPIPWSRRRRTTYEPYGASPPAPS